MDPTNRYLITGGCSFSFVHPSYSHRTWPIFLEQHLGCSGRSLHTALPAQGNGMISRNIIYAVTEALKTTPTQDILVAIMWSGPDRHEFFFDERGPELAAKVVPIEGWQNPTKFINTEQRKWYLVNHHWQSALSQLYYKHFHDMIGAYILSLEHILRTQWFLENHGIRYFMASYTEDVVPTYLQSNQNCQHLYDSINFDVWLPVTGAYEWARDCSNIEFDPTDLYHLNSEQNKKFFQDIIKPFLKEKNYE